MKKGWPKVSTQSAGFAHTPGEDDAKDNDKVPSLSSNMKAFRVAAKVATSAHAIAKPVVIRSRSLTAGDSATTATLSWVSASGGCSATDGEN